MFRHFIVPVDLTRKNARAIDTARDLAQLTDGRVTLLHVIETLDLPFDELEDFYRRLERAATDTLSEFSGVLADAGVPFEHHIVFGDPAEEVLGFASSVEDGLIVLSSHQVDLDQPIYGWATLSHKIAILSQSPILLVKGGAVRSKPGRAAPRTSGDR